MASDDSSRLWTFLSLLHSMAGPVLMLLYPLYASVMAIESPSKVDDEQWLAYWIIYSFLTLMEMLLQPVLEWIPICSREQLSCTIDLLENKSENFKGLLMEERPRGRTSLWTSLPLRKESMRLLDTPDRRRRDFFYVLD
ncbi:hypothetical protein Vadar_028127 [Vaccinium darrowii]|uniref:Uncharacterized protein n=1 Tax=Vaccinium darrowii TaxID=229202 RepID=A0ACB7ZNF3_9ERIC|nr:hypothetical protein Vadar_028127 [Vaccinium darrowii]